MLEALDVTRTLHCGTLMKLVDKEGAFCTRSARPRLQGSTVMNLADTAGGV